MVDSGDLWRDRNKLFVAGLPLYVDDNELYEKFKSFGEMHQSKVVYDKIVWPSLLPAGVSVQSAKFNVTGIEKFTARMAGKNLGDTKVTLSFELDSNGIAQIAKAEATLVEEVEVEVIVKKEKSVKKAKEKSDDGIEDDSTEAGEKDQSEVEEKPEVRLEKQTKTHREKLMVVRAYETHKSEQEMSVLTMSETLKKASMRMLNEMEHADNKRRADLEAKNSLETFIYKAHDTLSAQESEIKLVTIPEQVESLQSKLDETESWLYDDGDKVEAAEYNEKMVMLNSDLSAILFRVTELEVPIAIETAKQYVSNTRGLIDQWSTSKPQVTDEQRGDVTEKLDELEAWLTESETRQKAAPKHEKPVLTSTDVTKNVKGIKKFVAFLTKRPKPQPIKTDSNDTDTEKDGEDSKRGPQPSPAIAESLQNDPHKSRELNAPAFVTSAQLLHREVPIRIVRRIVYLENLLDELPQAEPVGFLRQQLLSSFDQLMSCPLRRTFEASETL
ncbi:hypothetical protein PsorP6_019329 [Peronosclerospora sorghi]|nr:hypothetical protein PsorP6_019329 [Peronosclerospora sorghi]